MLDFISLKTIKDGKLDDALAKFGYVRAKVMCEKWGISDNQLSKKFQSGYTCDNFKINNVRYISVNAPRP